MNKTRDFFDQLASTWEAESFPPETRKKLEALVDTFEIQGGARVLDAGTGTGILHPLLLRAVGETGWVLAFDLSYEMIARAAKKTAPASLLCLQADSAKLPLASDTFDHIVCFAAFPHFADQRCALQEMARVAKKDGQLVIAHLMSRAEIAHHHDSHPSVAGDHLPKESRLRRMLSDAGWRAMEITDEPGQYLARANKK
jgi:ubiquinone/menaquinone biosynthesis C-methylase UbiE